MNTKVNGLLKVVWLFIFSITHPITIALFIFYLGKDLDITFSSSTNVTLIYGKIYCSYAVIFNIGWYALLYFISLITKNNFSHLLNYNTGIKSYPIHTTLLTINSLLLINPMLWMMFPNLILENIDFAFFIFFILLLSYVIHINALHIFFAIYGYITLKTFVYPGMEGNVFGFVFGLPLLFFLIESFILFVKQSWMIITNQFSIKTK
ncbi:MAG: hypothetical protein WC747_01070 [Candidatus Babeliales bacterium]|jgi:hypothetical protein